MSNEFCRDLDPLFTELFMKSDSTAYFRLLTIYVKLNAFLHSRIWEMDKSIMEEKQHSSTHFYEIQNIFICV